MHQALRLCCLVTRGCAAPMPERILGAEFGYADVELWMKAELSIRRPFVQRWKAKAFKDPAFKQAIVANMSSHPEWDPILFPEKYLPKEPPPAPQAAPPAAQAQQPAAPAGTNQPPPSK